MPRFILDKPLRDAVDTIRSEAKRRGEITPSDATIEAFNFAASTFETAIAEAARASEKLTPEQYAKLHNVTRQSVTRWIRLGELDAEDTPNGYLIAQDAKRKERRKAS